MSVNTQISGASRQGAPRGPDGIGPCLPCSRGRRHRWRGQESDDLPRCLAIHRSARGRDPGFRHRGCGVSSPSARAVSRAAVHRLLGLLVGAGPGLRPIGTGWRIAPASPAAADSCPAGAGRLLLWLRPVSAPTKRGRLDSRPREGAPPPAQAARRLLADRNQPVRQPADESVRIDLREAADSGAVEADGVATRRLADQPGEGGLPPSDAGRGPERRVTP